MTNFLTFYQIVLGLRRVGGAHNSCCGVGFFLSFFFFLLELVGCSSDSSDGW